MRWAVLALLAGCASSSSHPASGGPSVDPGRAVFADRCETCHSEEDKAAGKPKLDGGKLDPITANNALKMVLRRAMPPDDDRLSRADLIAVGDWLCDATGRPDDKCRALVHNERTFAPNVAVFLTTAKRTSGKPLKEDATFLYEVREHMRRSVAAQALDPTMVLISTGLALETCSDGDPAPTDEQFLACIDAYIDSMTAPIAPPPGGQP